MIDYQRGGDSKGSPFLFFTVAIKTTRMYLYRKIKEMQRKTITRNVRSKMEDWLKSITDVKLRDDVKANLLVSGGSIASMFLNEDVNDYDVYIQDTGVLKRLTDYYCQKHSIKAFDGRERDALIETHYGEAIRIWEAKEEGRYQAEGYLFFASLKPGQVKMQTGGAGFRVDVKKDVAIPPYSPLFFSPNAISLSDDVQIVTRFSGTPEEIHESFDFIHATNYFTFADGLVTNIEAVESLLTKRLRYQGSKYPLTSIIRSKKFINRGWGISAGEYLKIMFQISELDLTDPEVLEDQLVGVDVAYFARLIAIVRGEQKKNVDFALTSDYLNNLIDRVFDLIEDE